MHTSRGSHIYVLVSVKHTRRNLKIFLVWIASFNNYRLQLFHYANFLAPDWLLGMTSTLSMDRNTPTNDKDKEGTSANKLWTPHKFALSEYSVCQQRFSERFPKSPAFETFQENMINAEYQNTVHNSPVSNNSNSPPPYPMMDYSFGDCHQIKIENDAKYNNHFLAEDRSIEQGVSTSRFYCLTKGNILTRCCLTIAN